MKKRVRTASTQMNSLWILAGWLLILFAAYGRLMLHPGLHTACPENDTWNLPVRWSVLDSLRQGLLPLWNPNSCFGIPWLATWQTETFYPGTLFFAGLGLNFWNYSGLFHLLILAAGIFIFLKKSGVHPFGAFTVSVIALLNACAFNHLGSNSSMDTMAWMPWIFVSVLRIKNKERWRHSRINFFLNPSSLRGLSPNHVLYLDRGFSFAGLKAVSPLSEN